MKQRVKLLFGMVLILIMVWAPGCSQEAGDAQEPGASNSESGDSLDLRLTFAPGQKWYVEMTNDSTILRTMQGQEVKTSQTNIEGKIIEVETVNSDGTAWVHVTHERVAVDGESYDMVNGKKVQMKFDSAAAQDKPAQNEVKALTAILGLNFKALLTDKGRVQEIQGLDQLYEGMMDHLDLPPGFPKEEYLPQLKQMYGDSFFIQSIEDVLAHYPEAPVKVGDTWSFDKEVMQDILVVEKYNYTLQSRKDDVAVIESASEISTTPQTMMGYMTQKMKTEITGAQQSTIEIDETTGWIKTISTREDINRKMTRVGDTSDDPKNAILTDVETTITVTISEVK